MNLTKKQVGAFLSVISKDLTRPALMVAQVSEYKDGFYLTATDGYQLAALKLDNGMRDYAGQQLSRNDLEIWYKLANTKSSFNEDELKELLKPEFVGFPTWQRVMPTAEPTALTGIRFNPEFVSTMNTLAGMDKTTGLHWDFYGSLGPLMASHEGNIYVIMPLKDR